MGSKYEYTALDNLIKFGAYTWYDINPFTLRAAKRVLTILEIFYLQKHFLGNI